MPEQKNAEPEPIASTPAPAAVNPSSSRLEELLAENLALTKEIYALTEKTRRYIYFAQVATVVKIILIVGPLIVAALFLPPYLKQIFSSYKELLGNGTGQTTVQGGGFIKNLFGVDLNNLQDIQDIKGEPTAE